MRTVLIHHHIFKNAGTSFNYALKQSFGENFLEFDLPNSKVVTKEILDNFIKEHPKALAISSHHACMPTPQGENYQTISSVILRKPLSRIRSIYNFERKQKAETQGAIKAKELNFKEYVIWRLDKTPRMFCNYQTFYCSRTKESQSHKNLTSQDLIIATENIANCAIVGTVEQYNSTLEFAEAKLKSFYPQVKLIQKCLNVTQESFNSSDEYLKESLIDDLGKTIVSKIEDMNYLDLALYDVANQIISRRTANVVICGEGK